MTETKPWHKLPNEKGLWFDRFLIFLKQKPPRSLLAIYNDERAGKGTKKSSSSPASWERARENDRWDERAEAYDAEQRVIQDAKWAALREAERAEELQLAVLMRGKARELLTLPVKAEEVKYNRNGEEIDVILVPEHRAFQAAAVLTKEARTHARGALEMPDKIEKRELTGRDGGPLEMKHSGDTPEERLAKLLALAEQAAATGSGDDLL